ncbi:putative beta-lactamase hcpD precursor [Glaesserella parasuis]|uniref:tetratricopeptide repeat protein n=1 Tax=Glaesserella parasuis TaxID=738 RepID=UPI0004DCE8D6|nr:SEL1-like repeat protein [Glaesserella parasuis]KEZ23783.1 putative beta-lactamase hcpD precursor [Glaesserella parasuis]
MKLNKTLLSTLLLSFAIAGNVYAETAEEKFDRAVQYAEQQNYQAAFPMFKELAEQGYAVAQFNLGVMYGNGQGVRQDKSKAKYYFGLACDNGEQMECDNYRKLSEQGY